MENYKHTQEDEIDPREYINLIIKKKKFILRVFVATVVIAAVANLLTPKMYEITSTVQLANVNETLIKKEEAKEIMLNQNSLLSIINELKLKIGSEELQKNIKISDLAGTNLLKITIVYPDVDKAIAINEAIVNSLINQGKIIYQKHLAILNERLKELGAEIKNAEEDISRTQTLISGIPNSNNISQSDASLRIILLQNTLPNYESNLTALRNQKNGLEHILVDSKDSVVFDAPIKSKNLVGPNNKQKVIVVFMFSLMFSLLLAFFLEFLQKDK
jgi:capsular polysaccharide biosynthesis protein